MDYEKKYKEALNWMRSIYQTMQGTDRGDAEHHFPELKETEDGKIRKEIIEYITRYKDCITDKEYDSWIAWLEKQGDYNRLVEEIKERKKLLSKEKEKAISTNDKLSLGGRIAILEELLAFTGNKQGEQKTSWSEEDEKRAERLLCLLDNEQDNYPQLSCDFQEIQEIKDWLKSIKPCWKPTIEQMQALKYEIESTNENSWQRRACEKLYEDLKKL